MTDLPLSGPPGLVMIEGRVGRRTTNSLTMTFRDGPGEPFAVAAQSGGDGKGAKLGMLFGFKNGGPGKHVVRFADGRTITVQSRELEPTLVTAADGASLAIIDRGDTSSVRLAGGTEFLRVLPDPEGDDTYDLFRTVLMDESGDQIGHLDVVRRVGGWNLTRAIESAWQTYIWWDQAGQSLPTLVLGTRVMLARPVSDLERDLLVAICVDIAIGRRPYITAMD
jgi:hypothetical protein